MCAPLLFLTLPPSMNCWWVRFRLIRIAETVAEWRLRIFGFDIMRVWGWLTLLPCASATGAVTFSKVMWRSLIWKILRHTHLYIYEYRLGVPKLYLHLLYLQTHIFDIEVRVRLTKLNGWLWSKPLTLNQGLLRGGRWQARTADLCRVKTALWPTELSARICLHYFNKYTEIYVPKNG